MLCSSRVRIRFSVMLASGYAHVFVLHFVVILTLLYNSNFATEDQSLCYAFDHDLYCLALLID